MSSPLWLYGQIKTLYDNLMLKASFNDNGLCCCLGNAVCDKVSIKEAKEGCSQEPQRSNKLSAERKTTIQGKELWSEFLK